MRADPATVGSTATLFHRAVHEVPDRVFLRRVVDDGVESRTFAEEAVVVGRLLTHLRDNGIRRGDRVVLQVDDLTTGVHLGLACFHAGIVPAFLAESFSRSYARALAERCGARLVLGPRDLPDLSGAGDPVRSSDGAELLGSPVDAAPTDLCLIQPTSGSTGAPKLVLTPHVSFTFGASRIFGSLPPVHDQRVLLVSSIAHGIGMVNLVGALLHRATVVVPSRIDIRTPREDLLALAPTFVYTTPRTLRAIAGQHPAGSTEPLLGASVRAVVVAGAQPDSVLLQRLHDEGVGVQEMYGSSEAGDLAMTRPGDWRPGWIGPAFEGVTLALADDGELLATTPGRMLGYEGDPATTAAMFTPDGAYRTGDLAEFDGAGRLRLVGRKVAVVNTAEGSNVHPERLEQRLGEIPGVRQAVVVGNGRPQLVAILSVQPDVESPDLEGPLTDAAVVLTPEHSPGLYDRIRGALSAVNDGLEPIEMIRDVVLVAGPLPLAGYRHLGHDKVRIDRPALEAIYADALEATYAAGFVTARTTGTAPTTGPGPARD